MSATVNHVSIVLEMEYRLFRAAPLSKPKVNLLYEHSGRPLWTEAGWQLTAGCNRARI